MTISLVNGVNPLQTTLLELGIVSGRVALLLRSAEIQPLFGRFVSNTSSVFTPSFLDLLLLQGASIAFTCACSALSGWMFATGLLPISVRILLWLSLCLFVCLFVWAGSICYRACSQIPPLATPSSLGPSLEPDWTRIGHGPLLHWTQAGPRVDLVWNRTGPGLDVGPCCIGPRPDLGWT